MPLPPAPAKRAALLSPEAYHLKSDAATTGPVTAPAVEQVAMLTL